MDTRESSSNRPKLVGSRINAKTNPNSVRLTQLDAYNEISGNVKTQYKNSFQLEYNNQGIIVNLEKMIQSEFLDNTEKNVLN